MGHSSTRTVTKHNFVSGTVRFGGYVDKDNPAKDLTVQSVRQTHRPVNGGHSRLPAGPEMQSPAKTTMWAVQEHSSRGLPGRRERGGKVGQGTLAQVGRRCSRWAKKYAGRRGRSPEQWLCIRSLVTCGNHLGGSPNTPRPPGPGPSTWECPWAGSGARQVQTSPGDLNMQAG